MCDPKGLIAVIGNSVLLRTTIRLLVSLQNCTEFMPNRWSDQSQTRVGPNQFHLVTEKMVDAEGFEPTTR